MKHRRFFLSFFGIFFVIVTMSAFSRATNMAGEEPQNILLITIDTLRADRLSCYSDDHDLMTTAPICRLWKGRLRTSSTKLVRDSETRFIVILKTSKRKLKT